MIALLALASAVEKPATAYFPADLTQPRMICDATRPALRTPVLSDHQVDWYSAQLAAAGEPALGGAGAARLGRDEVLRFLWLRSFDRPVVVRVRFGGKGGALSAHELSGKGGYEPGNVARSVTRELSREEARDLRTALAEVDLDQLPPAQCDDLRAGAVAVAADGARWIFEHVAKGRYHFVDRQNFGAAPVRPLGAALLKLTGWTYDLGN